MRISVVMAYLPIEDHGVIGNMHTAALMGLDGRIDWLCYPRFDSPSVFGAILDDEKGGSFELSAGGDDAVHKQFYWPDTNVLVTRFLSADGVGQVADFMPPGVLGEPGHAWLARRVIAVRGAVRFRLLCRPAFDYARGTHTTSVHGTSAVFRCGEVALELAGEVPLGARGGGAGAEFELEEGESVAFVLRPADGLPRGFRDAEAAEHFERTVRFWRSWLSHGSYAGRWRETVHEGIWEVRGGRRHFVHSKLMCWVALDRARRLAADRSFRPTGSAGRRSATSSSSRSSSRAGARSAARSCRPTAARASTRRYWPCLWSTSSPRPTRAC